MGDGYIPIGDAADFPEGALKCVAVDGERIVVARIEGRLFALRDRCGHKNAPLSRGRLVGHLVECPLHFALFDMRTGKLVDGPVSADVPACEVRLDGATVLLKR